MPLFSAEAPTASLLAWFAGRDGHVPWRREGDPYRVWVAEVMAQQTRMETVAPYYARFIDRFPSALALAEAPLDDVLKAWEGLGYYARARHLHAAARQVIEEHGGRVPSTVDGLRSLAGIGPYTAGAIASLAFGISEPAVDGNARRVLSRLFDLEDPTPGRLDEAARSMLAAAPDRPAAVNQAIMDLGRTTCIPRNPDCESCPISTSCRARTAGTVADRPPRSPRAPAPLRHATSAMVWRKGRVLVVRRPPDGLLGGLWDFPGVAPAAEEVGPDMLCARIGAVFGVWIRLGERVGTVDHSFSHFRLRLAVYEATWKSGEPASGVDLRWCRPAGLAVLAFPTYLRTFISRIAGRRRPSAV